MDGEKLAVEVRDANPLVVPAHVVHMTDDRRPDMSFLGVLRRAGFTAHT